ncbi:MAG: response regulator [Deltaproteobacteria bacterium]|nr:response regulator [Deltaproteobacteria bacterium]
MGKTQHSDLEKLLAVIAKRFAAQLAEIGQSLQGANPSTEITQALARCADAQRLVDQLQAISASQLLLPRRQPVAQTLCALKPRIGAALSANCKLTVQTDDDPSIKADVDAEQLGEAICALVRNADEAGARHVCVSWTRSDEGRTLLVVSDDGPGFGSEQLSRPIAPGVDDTGQLSLGLALAAGIAKQHGALIARSNAPTGGARVTIDFPAPRESVAKIEETSASNARGCRVAVVDDEPLSTRATRRVLRAEGYEVEVFETAGQALGALCNGCRVDALITDVVMPDMTGPELVRRLAEENRDMPTLFISGYPRAMVDDLPDEAAFLQKPYGTDDLAQALRALLAK